MIKDALINFLAIMAILLCCLLLIIAAMFGQQRRLGPWLVRGKHWLLDVLEGRRRINVTQAAILILGAVGALFIAWSDGLARWGFLIALAGQPFWIVETMRKRQWGMLALSIWYSGVWAGGAWRVWLS